ncbi:hypothetical protein Trydic_g19180 [Trypoxylus dichotomus]
MDYIAAENVVHSAEVPSAGDVVLSRKKRYLIFPDGTSLQLVYCFTIPVPNYIYIWTYGFTVSIAWLLPTDPEDILKFKRKKPEERVDKPTTSLVKYVESVNKVANKNKYSYPNFAQTYMPFYPHNNYHNTWSRPYYQQNNRKTYTYNRTKDQRYRVPTNGKIVYHQHEYHKHPLYTKLHRISRRDLYFKLEEFFIAQKKDGKACLLKAICEVSKAADDDRKGSFMDEIIKSVFRNKFSEEDEERDEYDNAANKEHNCDEMYPTCNDPE